MKPKEEKLLMNELLSSRKKRMEMDAAADHRIRNYLGATNEVFQLDVEKYTDEEMNKKMDEIFKKYSVPSDVYIREDDRFFDEDDIMGVVLDAGDMLNGYMEDDREFYECYLRLTEGFDLDIFYLFFGIHQKDCSYFSDLDVLVKIATGGKYTYVREKVAKQEFLEFYS